MGVNIYKARIGLILPALSRSIERSEGIFVVALQVWMDFAHKQIRRDLTEKYIKKDVTTELTDWEFIEEQGNEILKPATLKIMQRGGGQAYRILQAQVAFDVLNLNAVKAAGKLTANLVRGVTQNTKEGIRSHIKAGVKAGKSMNKIARELKPLVGLTKTQTESIVNYRSWLKEKRPDLSAAQVDKRVMSYTNKTHRRRMQTIARTETARAQSIGYAVGLEDLGIEQVEFQIHPDDKTCPDCLGLDGEKYKVGEGGGIIPVHPNCRCCLLPVIADKPTCRLVKMVKQIQKIDCIPPNSLHDKQIEDLLKRLEAPKTPVEGRKIRRALRRLGHKGGLGGKPPVTTSPAVKPTVPTVPKPKIKPAKPREIIPTEANGKVITPVDERLVARYTSLDHMEVVQAQLGKPMPAGSMYTRAEALKIAKQTEDILLKLPGWEGQSFRGLKFGSTKEQASFLRNFKVGGDYNFKAFQSATSDLNVAKSFMRRQAADKSVLLHIEGRAGRSVMHLSRNKAEKEILFMKNSRFSVTKIKGNNVYLKEIVGKPAIPKLFEATNIGKAEANARRILGIPITPKTRKAFSFKGVDVEAANHVNRALYSFKQKFPQLKLDGIEVGGKGKNIYAQASPRGNKFILVLDKDSFDNYKRLAKDMRRLGKTNYLVGDSIEDLIAHEMGHILNMRHLFAKHGAKARMEMTRLSGIRFNQKGLSKYGSRDGVEGLAEVFSKFMKTGSLRGISTAGIKRPAAAELAGIKRILKTYAGVEL